jgi:hypothetical protein
MASQRYTQFMDPLQKFNNIVPVGPAILMVGGDGAERPPCPALTSTARGRQAILLAGGDGAERPSYLALAPVVHGRQAILPGASGGGARPPRHAPNGGGLRRRLAS